MGKVIIHIEDGMLCGAYSDDPKLEVVVFDFDWTGDPEPLDEMRGHMNTDVDPLYIVEPAMVTPFDFE